jgi:hypothetical protein
MSDLQAQLDKVAVIQAVINADPELEGFFPFVRGSDMYAVNRLDTIPLLDKDNQLLIKKCPNGVFAVKF